MDNCIHWFYLCCGFLAVILIIVAISYKYNLELKKDSVKLKVAHDQNKQRIKELEKKNGSEQKQIDQLRSEIQNILSTLQSKDKQITELKEIIKKNQEKN